MHEVKPSQEDEAKAREILTGPACNCDPPKMSAHADSCPRAHWLITHTADLIAALLATVRAEGEPHRGPRATLGAGQMIDPCHCVECRVVQARAEGEQAGRGAERREVVAFLAGRGSPNAERIERGAHHAKG
jgi:hypothetical protein